jgi:hypothetical protein
LDWKPRLDPDVNFSTEMREENGHAIEEASNAFVHY